MTAMRSWPLTVDTVVLDVDGTLIDSNYHHTLAWWRAFRDQGHPVPTWRIHTAIGMGGDKLVSAVAGDTVEEELGDQIREAWERRYDELIDEVPPMPGARRLLVELRDRGFQVALASSGIPRHTERAVELLDATEHADTTTTSEDAEESKPHPELLEVALDRVDADRAVLVGDSVWDIRSANEAGIPAVALLCGGFSRAELEEEGAARVYADPEELISRLDDTFAST
jgi:HAD superfamily hydrolase (TIGR01509 family)